MILIFWTLDFQTWRKRKSSSFVDVFFRSLSKDFPLPSLVRFDSRFEAKLQSAKLSSVIREAKVTDPVVKRKGYEGVGGRTFAEIENRTPAMKYTLRLCRFSTLPGDSGSNLSMLSTTSFSLFFFFFFTSICHEANDHGMKRFALKFNQLWLLSIQNKLHFCAWQMYYRDDENMIYIGVTVFKNTKKKRKKIPNWLNKFWYIYIHVALFDSIVIDFWEIKHCRENFSKNSTLSNNSNISQLHARESSNNN